MKTQFYFGRKNSRTNYSLYKKEIDNFEKENVKIARWYKADIEKDKFKGWNFCIEIPKDIKPVRKQNADEYLFLYCL
jgi:hypothetical protein